MSGLDRPGEPLSVSTNLQPRTFLGLSLKLGLLNIVTLTLWRFWGRTDVRQRIWRSVRMNDDAFEYTGRGVELFIGFLIALVLLGLPFLLVVFGAQLLDPVVMASIILPLYILMFWLWGFGIFSAFRYMASRTTWRGIRFQLKGSAAGYGGHYLLFLFLSGITLGWFKPEADRKLSELTWDNLYLGDKRIRFRMSKSQDVSVYGYYALGWFGQFVGYFVLVFAVMAIFFAGLAATGKLDSVLDPASSEPAYLLAQSAASGSESQFDVSVERPNIPAPETIPTTGSDGASGDDPYATDPGDDLPFDPDAPPLAMYLVVYAVMAVIYPLWLLVWAPYHSAILRSIVAGITFDRASFRLDIKAMGLWWLTVTNLFFLLISLGFLMPWVQARSVKYIVERIKVKGDARLDDIQQAARGPKTGEGLADAFGFSLL